MRRFCPLGPDWPPGGGDGGSGGTGERSGMPAFGGFLLLSFLAAGRVLVLPLVAGRLFAVVLASVFVHLVYARGAVLALVTPENGSESVTGFSSPISCVELVHNVSERK